MFTGPTACGTGPVHRASWSQASGSRPTSHNARRRATRTRGIVSHGVPLKRLSM